MMLNCRAEDEAKRLSHSGNILCNINPSTWLAERILTA